jgi:hypothetical protein
LDLDGSKRFTYFSEKVTTLPLSSQFTFTRLRHRRRMASRAGISNDK